MTTEFDSCKYNCVINISYRQPHQHVVYMEYTKVDAYCDKPVMDGRHIVIVDPLWQYFQESKVWNRVPYQSNHIFIHTHKYSLSNKW